MGSCRLDEELLKTKKYKDFLEPLDKRVHAVEKFLRIFKRSLVYEVIYTVIYLIRTPWWRITFVYLVYWLKYDGNFA